MGSKCLSKVLIDGRSSLNVLYIKTFDGLGIARSTLHPSSALFNIIVIGSQAYPLRRITLPVTFGDPAKFHTERLQFDVVDFLGVYNAILGRPCYVKFVVVPNYTYIKLKMPSPHGIIMTSASFEAAYTYEQANGELASMMAAIRELAELQKVITTQGASDASKAGSGTFKSTMDTKHV